MILRMLLRRGALLYAGTFAFVLIGFVLGRSMARLPWWQREVVTTHGELTVYALALAFIGGCAAIIALAAKGRLA